MSLERRKQAWSSYWASGNIDSCVGGLVERRDGAIRNFWASVVSDLPDTVDCLDIATGNGSLPRLMLDIRQQAIRIDAVDVASLRPQWADRSTQESVRFHPGVAMEALPFADHSYDLVTSQFGIEYGQWPQALNEALRVCRPAGTLAFVMHHADSRVVCMGQAESAHQQFLLAQDGLLAAADVLIPHMVRVGAGCAPDADANAARKAYNEVMAALAQRLDAPVPDLLLEARDHVHAILLRARELNVATLQGYLNGYRSALMEAVVRTEELLQCALDRAGVDAAANVLGGAVPGRTVSVTPLVDGDDVLAWGVVAKAC